MANETEARLPDLENELEQLLIKLDELIPTTDPSNNANTSSIIISKKQNIVNLKSRIDLFYNEHPDIVNKIKDHFYDELIIYILKKIFDPSFNINDINETLKIFNKFFTEHKTIEIILNYFFDDLKQCILMKWYPDQPYTRLGLHLITPKILMRLIAAYFLKKSGAFHITSSMYPNQTDIIRDQKKNLSQQSTSNNNKFFLLIIFFILLCVIFGKELFRFLFYYFIGLICTVFTLYLFL